jgi:aqualysin 1
MKLSKLWFVLIVFVIAISSGQPVFAANYLAPVRMGNPKRVIQDRYIIKFKDGVSDQAVDTVLDNAKRGHGAVEHFRYKNAIKGFAATLNAKALESLRQNTDVEYVEQDQEVNIDTTQSSPDWGLDRLDQRNLPLSGTFSYTRTGAGVTAYIIDTGIYVSHSDFGGRAVVGVDEIGDGRKGIDCNGHGTHVAGTVGGKTYGVAKGVKLVAVRVLNCSGSGTNSGVVAGVDWVTTHHSGPSVANMSLGGGISSALDSAVLNSIKSGVVYSIAGGNSGANACNSSPARVVAAITVGATDRTDTRASWSNYGSCLDIFAPGVLIKSDWIGSTTATNTISGTSMATPHVTGVTALYLQIYPTASPSTVRNTLVSNATSNVVKSAGTNSPNKLLFSNY